MGMVLLISDIYSCTLQSSEMLLHNKMTRMHKKERAKKENEIDTHALYAVTTYDGMK